MALIWGTVFGYIIASDESLQGTLYQLRALHVLELIFEK